MERWNGAALHTGGPDGTGGARRGNGIGIVSALRTFLAGLGRYLTTPDWSTNDSSPWPTYAELAEAVVEETWSPYRIGWTAARIRGDRLTAVGVVHVRDGRDDPTAPEGAALAITRRCR